MTLRSVVCGTGSYLPQKCLTNYELPAHLETSHEWIMERTGIAARHIAAPNETTSALAVKAALKALEAAGMDPQDIDLIILGTCTPDNTFPSTATLIQSRLGIHKGFAFDVNAACSGFVFALATADNYLKNGMATKALVIGAETMTRIVDWKDRTTAVLFGDGAGAVVLEAQKDTDRGIIGSLLRTDGQGYDQLYVTGGPSTTQTAGTIYMNGRDVFKNAVHCLEEAVEDILKLYHTDQSEIDWLVPHQANKRIIDATAKKLNLSDEKVVHTGSLHANTSAASIPLALDTAVRDGRIKPGQLILCEAFAGGYAWGSNLIRM
ncbi:3-oxoacyl-[acyl-carrier-protein] synthase 3 [Candidatus Bealeia paramacronuclearis]|uniref:Beta-ketoacyl-[acyl-carrier-protein] synthase III n=1 Tax=Candidatus Bealeia paramacronuclearis TaxID=1921001 RepID=A0ABZ2C2P8_9PROT|nr:3-oxoacyl-[acyl-carrier-protein] synthase 3 [Candidatus Bealeia paramacronuclearis]